MAKLQLRLRFKKTSSLKPEKIFERIEKQFDLPKAQFTGWVSTKHAMINIREGKRQYWSPQLNIEVEEIEKGSLIRCLYGPNPTVWTLFIFFYMLISFLGLANAMYGLTQLTLNYTPWAFGAVPIFVFLLLAVYYVARIRQKMGNEQMTVLQAFLDEVLAE